MIKDIHEIFLSDPQFKKFNNMKFNYIDAIYVSTEQIYAISFFEDVESAKELWEEVADELAVKIQGRLKGELNLLKWDIYLLIVIDQEEIEQLTRKNIENDRQYFRKIVISREDYPYQFKLSSFLELKDNTEALLFNDEEFFTELKNKLLKNTIDNTSTLFFESNLRVEEMLKFFEKSRLEKDKQYED